MVRSEGECCVEEVQVSSEINNDNEGLYVGLESYMQ